MTATREKIRTGLRDLIGYGKYEIFTGDVTKVNKAKCTIDVEINKDVTVYDVTLKVVTTDDKGIVVFPKKGSTVVIGKRDGGEDCCLLQASEIDTVVIKGGKLKVENNGQDLKTILNALIDAINQITVNTQVGPSIPPIINAPAFTAIKQQLNQILE